MKRKPQAFFGCRKYHRWGTYCGRQNRSELAKVETPETLLAEPQNLHLSPSNAKKRSAVIYGGEDVTITLKTLS
jgi:hypothetical protein